MLWFQLLDAACWTQHFLFCLVRTTSFLRRARILLEVSEMIYKGLYAKGMLVMKHSTFNTKLPPKKPREFESRQAPQTGGALVETVGVGIHCLLGMDGAGDTFMPTSARSACLGSAQLVFN